MNNNTQQTAVEWLKKELETYGSSFKLELSWELLDELINQAKELEKKHIINAPLTGLIHPLEMEATKQAEQYYNETFNQQP